MATMVGTRGAKRDLIETLVTEQCGECHIRFAIPEALMDRAKANHSVRFYCPNGHHISYRGQTTSEIAAETQRQRAEMAEAELAYTRRQRDAQEAEAQHQRKVAAKAQRRASAIKAHRDRVLRLVGLGICPVGKCGRDLGAAVQEHLATEHPKFRAHQVVEALREEAGA